MMNKLDLLLKLSYDITQKNRIFLTDYELGGYGICLSNYELRIMLAIPMVKKLVITQIMGSGISIILTDHGIRFCESNSFSNPGTSVLELKISA